MQGAWVKPQLANEESISMQCLFVCLFAHAFRNKSEKQRKKTNIQVLRFR